MSYIVITKRPDGILSLSTRTVFNSRGAAAASAAMAREEYEAKVVEGDFEGLRFNEERRQANLSEEEYEEYKKDYLSVYEAGGRSKIRVRTWDSQTHSHKNLVNQPFVYSFDDPMEAVLKAKKWADEHNMRWTFGYDPPKTRQAPSEDA